MTINELKAKAYDLLAAIQHFERELQKTNAEIAKLEQEQNAARNDNNHTN